MSKKKLLHIQLLPLLSGVQNMMLELLNEVADEYEIYVVSKPGGPLVDAVLKAGYNHIPVKSLRREFSLYDIVALFELIHIIRKHRFDIVHTHSSKTGFLGRIAARLAGTKKVIHTVHGYAFHEHQNKNINYFYKLMEKIAAHFCDRVVFVNNFERVLSIREKLVSKSKAVTIYNSVDLNRFRVKKQQVSKSPLTIGSVLRFSAQKNMINTIKAAIDVCKKRNDINFIFVGDGQDFLKCKNLVEEANLNMRILLTGWQGNIQDLLPKLDVFLLYSRWEGLPISILEAMACGLPVVCSDIKGNNELVDESNGILVPINQEDKLVEEILTLPERHNDLIKWSKESRRKVENVFSKAQFIDNYREIYES